MDCEVCHVSTEIWSKVELAVHPMELDNGHAELECFECHFRPDFRNVSGFTCIDCHTKPHVFGGDDCSECHVGGGGWGAVSVEEIDHLAIWEGYRYHEAVDCRGCHFGGFGTALSPECDSCHSTDGS
jgi:hypothetical protein